MADLILLPIHYHPDYMNETCRLINREWPKSFTARYLSLSTSCDKLPTSFVLVNQKTNLVVGHAKVTAVKTIPSAVYIESVVIDKIYRGKGWGLELMKQLHSYLVINLNAQTAYLSTKGQEKFYMKLGYEPCDPIPLYGGFPLPANQIKSEQPNQKQSNTADQCKPNPANEVKSNQIKTNVLNGIKANPVNQSKPNAVNGIKFNPADQIKSNPGNQIKSNPADQIKSNQGNQTKLNLASQAKSNSPNNSKPNSPNNSKPNSPKSPRLQLKLNIVQNMISSLLTGPIPPPMPPPIKIENSILINTKTFMKKTLQEEEEQQ
ncbi:hypothetical protein M8J75_003729 [Diaphorina citri]|nr:hypothetical protein M8J75_003729 [Diaphorina citri]